MIPKKDNCNIVLAGFWNRAIFTPEWVGRLLFKQPEVETLISIMPHMPIIYRNRLVAMEVAPAWVTFRPRALTDECLRASEEMAYKVLDTLRDTPLMGVGINFAFSDAEPRRDLAALFQVGDSSSLADDGWVTEERRLVRRLQKGKDTLNLTLVLGGAGNLDAEFNFHTETADNAIARAAVENRILGLRNSVVRLLEKTYELQVDWGGEDNG
jgi:hypothetical protein